MGRRHTERARVGCVCVCVSVNARASVCLCFCGSVSVLPKLRSLVVLSSSGVVVFYCEMRPEVSWSSRGSSRLQLLFAAQTDDLVSTCERRRRQASSKRTPARPLRRRVHEAHALLSMTLTGKREAWNGIDASNKQDELETVA